MAQLPKCCDCEYYIFGKSLCKKYNGKIPKETLFEKIYVNITYKKEIQTLLMIYQ